MRQPTCPKCQSAHTLAINALFGTDPQTLKQGIYIVFQCGGCGEIFMRLLDEARP